VGQIKTIPYLKDTVEYLGKVLLIIIIGYFGLNYFGLYEGLLLVIFALFASFSLRPGYVGALIPFYFVAALIVGAYNSDYVHLLVYSAYLLVNLGVLVLAIMVLKGRKLVECD